MLAADAGEGVVDLQPGPAEPGGEIEAVVAAAAEAGVEVVVAEAPAPAVLGAEPQAPAATIERLGQLEVQSRYAPAMLLYPFLDRLGVCEALAALSLGEARRYDAQALILSACFSFALGSGSLEQAKHLQPTDAGALLGLQALPSLRTLRPWLAALAEVCDPLLIQRQFARAMLQADEQPPELFYVDDHFVSYWAPNPSPRATTSAGT